MAIGKEGFFGGVKFHPNLVGTGGPTTRYINKKVEENRKELHEKVNRYGKDYGNIIHGVQRNKTKLKNSSMLDYTEQMRSLQQDRWFVPARSVVHSFNGRAPILPRDKQLPQISRSLDGSGFQTIDRSSICSPKSIVSKSSSFQKNSFAKRKTNKTDAYRLKFDSHLLETNSKEIDYQRKNSTEKLVPQKCRSPETPAPSKVNAPTGSYNGIMKVGEDKSTKGKTVTIKLPVLNKDIPGEGMTLSLEPQLLVDKDYESNVSTQDNSSEYDIEILSSSDPADDEKLKSKRRQEHTRFILRDAVEKLREIEEKYKNPTPIVIPKLKKTKRLSLSSSLESIPEAISEVEKQEADGIQIHRKKYIPTSNLVKTPRNPVVVKPSLDVIPEFTRSSRNGAIDSENTQELSKKGNAFKGGKLHTRFGNSTHKNNRYVEDTDSGLATKIEDDFKSKRLHLGSKFGARHKNLKYLKAC